MNDAGVFSDEGRTFTMTEPYLGPHRLEGSFEHGRLVHDLRGWCYQLEEYAAALEVAGLAIARLRDPAPSRDDTQYARWHRVPMFFHVRAVEWGVEGKIDRW